MFILVFIAHSAELERTSLKPLKQSVSAQFSSLANLEAISHCTTSVPISISAPITHIVLSGEAKARHIKTGSEFVISTVGDELRLTHALAFEETSLKNAAGILHRLGRK